MIELIEKHIILYCTGSCIIMKAGTDHETVPVCLLYAEKNCLGMLLRLSQFFYIYVKC